MPVRAAHPAGKADGKEKVVRHAVFSGRNILMRSIKKERWKQETGTNM